MSNDIFNRDGCPDPTAGAALSRVIAEENQVRRRRPMVYICSPYAGDVKNNIIRARRYCRFAVERGYMPVASHLLYPQFLRDKNYLERQLGIQFGRQLIAMCKEIWVFGEKITAGMKDEIQYARRQKCEARYFSEDCKLVTA